MRDALGLLRRERDFRRVFLAYLVSMAGDWFALIPLLTVLPRLTGSGLWGGLVLATDTVLFAALAPYAGTLADRLDRRRLMVGADVASAGLVCLLLLVHSRATVGYALLGIAGVAAAKAFYEPSAQAALPNLVDGPDLPAANVLVGSAWGSMLAVGAALGGLAAAAFGNRACYLLDAASFLVSAALTAGARRSFQEVRPPVARRPAWRDLRDAAGYARARPRVLALLAAKAGPGLGNGGLSLFPLLATGVLGAGPMGTGLLYAARGAGALLGPTLLRRVALRPRRLLPVLGASMALYGAAYFGVAAAPTLGIALAFLVLAHLGGGANWTLSAYGLQVEVADAMRGRVLSADVAIATLSVGASQVLAGVLSDLVPVRTLLSGCGAVTLGYAALWWLAARRTAPTSPAEPPADPPAPPVPAPPPEAL